MFSLKPITREAIPRAIEKAERYRLLNQPWAAESICEDILAIEPAHQVALRILLLSHTDQFTGGSGRGARADAVRTQLTSAYERAYYAGIILERRAKAKLDTGHPGASHVAYGLFRDAMSSYEDAERVRPSGNDDAILRWNACARMLDESPNLVRAATPPVSEPVIGE